MPTNDAQTLADIADKLDAILGILVVRGMEDDVVGATRRMKDLGLSTHKIAQLTGVTDRAVQLRLQTSPSGKAPPKANKKSASKPSPPDPAAAPATPGGSGE